MRILAIDLGTGALKALVFDGNLAILGRATAPIRTRRDLPGQAEQDVSNWVAAMQAAASAALEQAGAKAPDAIVFTGHMSAPCFIGGDGSALAPVQTLSDTRSMAFVRDDPLAVAITGNRSATHFGRAKIARQLAEHPELLHPDVKILAPKDVLRLAMGGSFATDVSDASNLLLVDPKTGLWSDALLTEACISATLLPSLKPAASFDGVLNKEWAARIGLPNGIPLVTGAADMATAALAGHVGITGRLLITVGTSATSLIACEQPIPDLVDRLTYHTDGLGRGFVLGSHFNGGACLDWFHALGGGALDNRDTALNALSKAAELRHLSLSDPIFLSSLLGAGSPHFDPSERGAFLGLGREHDRIDLFRAILEGISFELAATAAILEKHGFRIEHVLAGGGGMRIGMWPQMLADVMGHEVRVTDSPDASAEGAAMLVLETFGLPLPEERRPIAIFTTEPAKHALHAARHLKLSSVRQAIGNSRISHSCA